jgi:hypothetical protein
MNIKIEEEMAVLKITMVLERHFKDLVPREVNHIQNLKTFVVPAKVERVKGRTIIHRAIIFYQSDSTQSLKNMIITLGKVSDRTRVWECNKR